MSVWCFTVQCHYQGRFNYHHYSAVAVFSSCGLIDGWVVVSLFFSFSVPLNLAPVNAELDQGGLTALELCLRDQNYYFHEMTQYSSTLKLLYLLQIYNIYNLLSSIRQGENIKLNGSKTIHIVMKVVEFGCLPVYILEKIKVLRVESKS